MDINWYPGHMAKTRRMMRESLRAVDLVLEVLDARVPAASQNPDFEDLLGHKKRLILLNKADLAEEEATRAWVAWLEGRGRAALAVSAGQKGVRGRILKRVEALMADDIRRMDERGARKTVRALVAGIPNVGKSTIINALAGSSAARAADRPGVTRGKQTVRVTPFLELVDTPGLLWPKLEDPVLARHLAYTGAIRDEAIDPYRLCLAFLEEMASRWGGRLAARYRLTGEELSGPPEALLETICRRRGFVRAGGGVDEERGVAMVFNEYRGGKLGPITLEMPPETEP